MLGSRNPAGGLAHGAGDRRALSQTWRESDMREGGGRKGLAPKDQSLSCPLLIWLKSFSVGKDCSRDEKGTTEDEMVARHHRLNGYELE